MPLSDAGRHAALLGGLTNVATHLSLHTAFSDAGSSEVTGGSPAYARKAVTAWASPASGASTAPSVAVTFDVPAGTTVHSMGLWSALTAGTHYGWAPLNASLKGVGTVIAADVTANTITSASHGLTNTNTVVLNNLYADSLPTGLSEATTYYVVGATTDTFQLALTSGGSAIDITAAGELHFQKYVPEVFGSQGQITVAINAFTLDFTTI